jgi:hypothetical protein
LKEGVLRTFIALKSPSPSTGFEPANLGSNSKKANHFTTEDDLIYGLVSGVQYFRTVAVANEAVEKICARNSSASLIGML